MKILIDEETGQRYEAFVRERSVCAEGADLIYIKPISPKREKFKDNAMVGFKAYEYQGIPIIAAENPERAVFELNALGYRAVNFDQLYHQIQLDRWAKTSEGWCP